MNVPPESWPGVIDPSRTACTASARASRPISVRDFRVGVEDRRHDERVVGGDGDADVHPEVGLEPLASTLGPVDPRELTQRERQRP